MEIVAHIKLFLANISLAAVLFSGQAAFSSVKSVARHITAKNVEITNMHATSPQEQQTAPPQRIILTERPPEVQMGTVTSVKTLIDEKGEKFEVGNKNPFQKPSQSLKPTLPILSPTPSEKQNRGSSISQPSPSGSGEIGTKPTPSPQPLPKATAGTASPAPQSTVEPTQTPVPSPDFTVGTLLIGNNPLYAKTGATIRFSVFVRDADEQVIKNKALTFLINGQAVTASTDESGNAFLEVQAPGIVGDFKIVLQLGQKSASFSVNVIDSKPVLSLSSFTFDIEGYSVRLRNAAGEAVPNWQVTAYKRDGGVLGIKTTSELGTANFDLPPREAGGHMYACAEVKDVGRGYTAW